MSEPAGAPPQKRSDVRTRVISAIVLGIVTLAFTWAGGIWFRIFAALVGAMMLHEWLTISRSAENRLHAAALWVAMASVALALIADMGEGLVAAIAVIGILLTLATGSAAGAGPTAALGFAYAAVSALALAALRGDTLSGFYLILFLFAVVWTTDICAFFVGRALRGPKLAPSISPGKTWSGALGGTACAIVAAIVYSLLTGVPIGIAILAAVVLSVLSQIGDLAESAAKRRFGVKDSGWVIPGHGGVLDRVDGLVAAGIALYALTLVLSLSGAGSLAAQMAG